MLSISLIAPWQRRFQELISREIPLVTARPSGLPIRATGLANSSSNHYDHSGHIDEVFRSGCDSINNYSVFGADAGAGRSRIGCAWTPRSFQESAGLRTCRSLGTDLGPRQHAVGDGADWQAHHAYRSGQRTADRRDYD